MAGLADALAGEEMDPATDGDMFGDAEPVEEGDGMAFGEGDESELDPIFASDAAGVFPDMDDDQLLALQKIIDARCIAMAEPGGAYAEPAPDMGEDLGMSFEAPAEEEPPL